MKDATREVREAARWIAGLMGRPDGEPADGEAVLRATFEEALAREVAGVPADCEEARIEFEIQDEGRGLDAYDLAIAVGLVRARVLPAREGEGDVSPWLVIYAADDA